MSRKRFFRITGPLWWKSTADRCIPLTNGPVRRCSGVSFLHSEHAVEQTFEVPTILAAFTLIRSHCNVLLQVDLSKIVAVNSATAHPHEDPDGTIHNLGMVHKGKPAYAIIKMTPPAPGELSCFRRALYPLKSECRHDVIFAVTDGTACCRYDNLRCHQCNIGIMMTASFRVGYPLKY